MRSGPLLKRARRGLGELACELMDSGQGLQNPGSRGDLCSTSEVRLAASTLMCPEVFMSAFVGLCCLFTLRCISRISVPSLLCDCLSMSLGRLSSVLCPVGVAVHFHSPSVCPCTLPFVSSFCPSHCSALFSGQNKEERSQACRTGPAPSLALADVTVTFPLWHLALSYFTMQ